ncbi:MAG: GTPase [Promethearchaeota archaeon]
MSKVEEKIRDLEERLEKTAINKHTMKSICYIKAQLAKLQTQLVEITSSKKGGGGGFGIKKSGDATVAFIGFPSVGKSSLLNLLTEGHTDSKVAAYDFTTINAIPGMMEIESAKIQLLDLPGIILGAAQGKGRGKEILAATRNADLILILICFRDNGTLNIDDLITIRKELYNVGIRLDKRAPRVKLNPLTKGGIGVTFQVKQTHDLNEDMVKIILNEYKIRNANVFIYDDLTTDEFIDAVLGNRRYIKELIIINKEDLANRRELKHLPKLFKKTDYTIISALKKKKIAELRHKIFNKLELIRIYMKQPGKEADLEEPMIMRRGDTIEKICRKIHKDFVRLFKYAQIWGPSSKHPGQIFRKMSHIIKDGDVIQIILKK